MLDNHYSMAGKSFEEKFILVWEIDARWLFSNSHLKPYLYTMKITIQEKTRTLTKSY